MTALLAVAFPSSANDGDAKAQANMNLGKRVFTQTAEPACMLCHALKAAGSTVEIGPNLDELKPDTQRVATAVKNGLGIMPAFAAKLTEEQIQAVAQYVARASGATK